MGIKYLWDTNTAIYYLQKQYPPPAESFIDDTIAHYQPVLSAITEIELLCWKHSTLDEEKKLAYFINDCLIIELEQTVKHKTAEIRKQHRIKLPDAIITASAIVYNLILISRNVNDFKNIGELQVVNPWEK